MIEEDCKIIFPGVGSFSHAMKVLNAKGWTKSLQYQVLKKEDVFRDMFGNAANGNKWL